MYTVGIYLGVALSSLTILIVNNVGWRNAYRISAGVSIIITFLTLFINEPKRGKFNSAAKREAVHKREKEGSHLRMLWNDIKSVTSSWLFIVI